MPETTRTNRKTVDPLSGVPTEHLIRTLLRRMEIGAVLVMRDKGDHYVTYKAGRFPNTNMAVIELHHLTEDFINSSSVDDQGMQFVWDITKNEKLADEEVDPLSETTEIKHKDMESGIDQLDDYVPTETDTFSD